MNVKSYTDLAIVSAKHFLKFTGVFAATSDAEYRANISLFYVNFAYLLLVYLNVANIIHCWRTDLSYCIYCCTNILCGSLAIFKVIVLRIRTFELQNLLLYAQQNFWHYDYDLQEQLIFAKCRKYCKLWIIFIYCAPSAELFFYGLTPIFINMGRNDSTKELPLNLWVDWPASESPYYELIYIFEMLCLLTVAIAYVCGDTFLCILNMHVISQFQMLQYRMLSFWNSKSEQADSITYTDHCFAALKKCIRQHQALIEFCEKIEDVFTFMILGHMIVFSLLMGFQCYEMLLSDATLTRRLIMVFHVSGSFIHIVIFSYCCHGLMEESGKICESIYFGSWDVLPMNKRGRSVRLAVKFIMIRSLKPCCLTAGGFFPISLETATALFSSTVSYFTLMRESLIRSENS